MRYLFTFFLVTWSIVLTAQGRSKVYDTTSTVILQLSNGKLTDTAGGVLFTMRGNIIFSGDSYANEDILYLLKSQDIFSRQAGLVYDKHMKDIIFSTRKGEIYVGENRYSENRLLYMKKKSNLVYEFYDGQSKERLGNIIGEKISNTELMAIFLGLLEHFNLDATLRDKIELHEYAMDKGIKGIIRPYSSSHYSSEWTWDGRILKPRFGHRPEDEWVYDGKTLKPYWGMANQEKWSWNGEVLKPYWEDIPELNFLWDEHTATLRPYWEYKKEEEWKIEDGRAWPKWSTDFRKEWVIEGEVPLPVIAFVILGIADR